MGKVVRVFHRPSNPPYSVLMEHKLVAGSVLFECQTAAELTPAETESVRRQYVRHSEAYGCLGVLQTTATDESRQLHLVLVTGCSSVGRIGEADVYRVTQTALVPLQLAPPATAASSAPSGGVGGGAGGGEDDRVGNVRKLLASGVFYFMWSTSDGVSPNFTLCEQRRHTAEQRERAEDGSRSRTVDIPDNRFFWNRQLHTFLRHCGITCERWLLRVVCGAVEVRTVYAGASRGQLSVVARLSCERAGTRFQTRGCCDSGHVANFVECEQSLRLASEWLLSHVQIRGSVPLFWEQPGVQVGAHKVRVTRGEQCVAPALRRHLTQLKRRYGRPVIVNLLSSSLVGSRGDEAALSALFHARHRALPEHADIEHVVFDYHALVRGGGGSSDQLQQLRDTLQPHLEEAAGFAWHAGTVLERQTGVMRTNCLDCLDRTNCVQSMIAQQVLARHLVAMAVDSRSSLAQRAAKLLQEMWQQVGNEVSRMYAGTGALQGGSRLMDGARSVSRTIQNNLMDSAKQEAIDVLLAPAGLAPTLAERARVLLEPAMLAGDSLLVRRMCEAQDEFSQYRPLHVTVGTYNVNGGRHFRSVAYKHEGLEHWLLQPPSSPDSPLVDPTPPADVFAIAFEEIVDLNASNMVAASSEHARLWNSELERVLSRENSGAQYVSLTSVQLVGVALFLFVRRRLVPFVRNVATDTVKTGMGGATGNKGAVAVSFLLHNTSLCFIGAHLAAGQKEVAERNSDYADIVRRLSFPQGRYVFSHDYVVFCGDFNYRIDLPRDRVLSLIEQRDWSTLLQHDQLHVQKGEGRCFAGFVEGSIAFAPTYKYDLFSDDYDTGEKCRCPAWTDRVMVWPRRRTGVNADALRVLHYGCAPLRQSDHRPVVCRMQLQLRRVDAQLREATLQRLIGECGPPDATVLLHCPGLHTLTEEQEFMGRLLDEVAMMGEVLLVRFPDADTMAVTLRQSSEALAVLHASPIRVLDASLSARLVHDDWQQRVAQQLEAARDNTIPLVEAAAGCPHAVTPEDQEEDTLEEEDGGGVGAESVTAAMLWHQDAGSEPIKPQRISQPLEFSGGPGQTRVSPVVPARPQPPQFTANRTSHSESSSPVSSEPEPAAHVLIPPAVPSRPCPPTPEALRRPLTEDIRSQPAPPPPTSSRPLPKPPTSDTSRPPPNRPPPPPPAAPPVPSRNGPAAPPVPARAVPPPLPSRPARADD